MSRPQFFGNVHFMGIARIDRGEPIIIASHSHDSETDLNGVKQVLGQPNIKVCGFERNSIISIY